MRREKLVKLGDGYYYLPRSMRDIGNTRAKAKAFDDRVGVALPFQAS